MKGDNGRAEVTEVLRIDPAFSAPILGQRLIYEDKAWIDGIVPALHKAGLK